ncbi:MAG: ABC transporter permease [Caldilineaceae bacterium]
MTNLNPSLLLRLAWRHAWRRPLQSLFLVIGVAIGVAMIVAIDLANGSAQRAFELGAETVAGRATHLIIGGPSGLAEDVYVGLRRQVDYQLSAPVVEAYVTVRELDAQPMRLLGVDPFAEAPFRSYLRSGDDARGANASFLRPLMVQPNTVLISSDVARQYGVQVGDVLTAEVGGQAHRLEVVGLLEPSDDLSRRALEGLLIADIATAQEVLGRVGRLSRIDLIVPEGGEGEAALERIAAVLPPGARIERAAARAGAVSEMTAAFRLNLTALSLLALVVGMFLIYNTVTFSVVQRRGALGSLRSLGMTRAEIFALILSEAGLLGLIGTLFGLGLGIGLGFGAVRLVTQTVNDLFFVVAVREVDIPTFTLVKAAVIGILAALIGAAIPAYEATSSPPAGAMRRSNMEDRARALLPWLTLGGVGLLAIGAALLIPDWHLIAAFGGLFAVILGCALLTPALTLLFMRGAAWVFGKLGQATAASIIERMAARTVIRAQPHFGGRGRAHGGRQRHHRRGRDDWQLPQHGARLAGRRAASRHFCDAAQPHL